MSVKSDLAAWHSRGRPVLGFNKKVRAARQHADSKARERVAQDRTSNLRKSLSELDASQATASSHRKARAAMLWLIGTPQDMLSGETWRAEGMLRQQGSSHEPGRRGLRQKEQPHRAAKKAQQ